VADRSADDQKGRESELAVNDRVRVNPGTESETHGVIVEDFGDMPAQAVDIGDNHFADPSRRWAVVLESGTLLFADSEQLLRE
jgi:hypothetical protein